MVRRILHQQTVFKTVSLRRGNRMLHALRYCAGVSLFSLLCCPVRLAAQARIISFDAPAADTTPGDFNGTYPSGINNLGVIAGAYQDANSTYHGFLRYPDGKFTTFDVPGADLSPFHGTSPNGLNDVGVVAGEYYDASGLGHGFLRGPRGEFTMFDVPGAAGYGSTPIALNLEGATVGYYTDSNYLFHGFLRHPDGSFATIDGPDACDTSTSTGCFGTAAFNIDVFGTIVGAFEDNSGNFVQHGFVRTASGKLSIVDVPGAGTGQYQGTGCAGCSIGFNTSGAMAATYTDANNVKHGFLRSRQGNFTTFDAPGAGTGAYQGTGCFSDCPVSLNDWGALTGVYIDGNNVFHGYLRSPAGKFTTFDPPGSIFTLPYSINDWGVITGVYIDTNNVYHGFIRTPDE